MPSSSGDNILEVFFSYSHRDETLCDELNAHLAALKRQNVIKNWTDRRITAGGSPTRSPGESPNCFSTRALPPPRAGSDACPGRASRFRRRPH
jgi:hypothetical protein